MIFLIILLLLATCGRLACSRICPLGIIEELIYKIPFPKKFTRLPGEKYLLKIKYVIFALLLVLVPLVFMPNKRELARNLSLYQTVQFYNSIFALAFYLQTILQILLSFWSFSRIFQQNLSIQIRSYIRLQPVRPMQNQMQNGHSPIRKS